MTFPPDMGQHQVHPPRWPQSTLGAPAPSYTGTARQVGQAVTKHHAQTRNGAPACPVLQALRLEGRKQSQRRAPRLMVTQQMNTKLGCKAGLSDPASSIHLWSGVWIHLRATSAAAITWSLCPASTAPHTQVTQPLRRMGALSAFFLEMNQVRLGKWKSFIQGQRDTRGSCFTPRPLPLGLTHSLLLSTGLTSLFQ